MDIISEDAVVDLIKDLMYYDFNEISSNHLEEIYGKELGSYLMNKYIGFKRNFLQWYGYLDQGNKETLIEAFMEKRNQKKRLWY